MPPRSARGRRDGAQQRLSTGRLKVFRTLQSWLAEYRLYRRDEKGAVVKKDDHLMDATRYFVVSGLPLCTVAPDAGRRLVRTSHHRSDYDPLEELQGSDPDGWEG